MKTFCSIYFSKLPAVGLIVSNLKNHTELDIKANIYLSEGFAELFHPDLQEPESLVQLCMNHSENVQFADAQIRMEDIASKESLIHGHAGESEILLSFFSDEGWTYLAGATAAVMQNMGGNIKHDSKYALPDWTRMTWQGIEWWKSCHNKF